MISEGEILLVPLTALIITQACKLAIDTYRKNTAGKTLLESLNSYGGMPSAHSALFAALVTVSYLLYGWDSFQFTVAFILYVTIVRDAVGIRWHLGEHGAILKQLIQEHTKDHEHIAHKKIVTRLGHTPLQATIGTCIGISIAMVMHLAVFN